MVRYTSRKERRSRLADQEAKHFVRQTVLILIATLILIIAIIFLGIPAFIKIAVFLADIRSSSAPIEQQDTIPPATPQLDTLPTATKSAVISLKGYAEPQATINIYINGQQKQETLTNDDGTFSLDRITLTDGLNRIYGIAVDASGNESPQSPTQTIIVDNDAPAISIDSPVDGSQFFGPTQQLITLKGGTDPDNNIRVNGQVAVVQPDGSFNASVQLKEGDNPVVIDVSDLAGNTTTTTVTYKYYP